MYRDAQMKSTALLIPLLILMAGCNQAPNDVTPESTQLPEVAPAAAGQVPAAETSQIAEMTITPIKTDDCKPRRYTAEISWVIPATQPYVGVEVRVSRPDGGLMAYKRSRKSTARTGNWVSSGAQFFLVDRETKTVVAQVTAGEYDCS